MTGSQCPGEESDVEEWHEGDLDGEEPAERGHGHKEQRKRKQPEEDKAQQVGRRDVCAGW